MQSFTSSHSEKPEKSSGPSKPTRRPSASIHLSGAQRECIAFAEVAPVSPVSSVFPGTPVTSCAYRIPPIPSTSQPAHLLIKGPAGTGKTLILVLRASELCRRHEEQAQRVKQEKDALSDEERQVVRTAAAPGRRSVRHSGHAPAVQLVTYATTLVEQTKHLAAQVLPPEAAARIDMRSYHSWAAQRLAQVGLRYTTVQQSEQEAYLLAAVAITKQHSFPTSSKVRDNSVAWWRDELAWLKGTLLPGGRLITTFADYATAARMGRGAALQAGARRIVWEVYHQYEQTLASRRVVDWSDLTRLLLLHYRQREQSDQADRPDRQGGCRSQVGPGSQLYQTDRTNQVSQNVVRSLSYKSDVLDRANTANPTDTTGVAEAAEVADVADPSPASAGSLLELAEMTNPSEWRAQAQTLKRMLTTASGAAQDGKLPQATRVVRATSVASAGHTRTSSIIAT